MLGIPLFVLSEWPLKASLGMVVSILWDTPRSALRGISAVEVAAHLTIFGRAWILIVQFCGNRNPAHLFRAGFPIY